MQPPSLPLAMLALSASVGLLFAESVPPLINYQGRLTDAAGSVLPDGPYRVAFRLWDDPAASATNLSTYLIWGREQDVTLIQGAFNVILGNGGGIAVPGAATNDLAAAFANSNRFLGLTITHNLSGDIAPNQQHEILPRQQILSAPFALAAQQAQHAEQAAVASALVKDLADALCPPGSIMPFGGNQVPDGWLLCDGSARSSVVFPRLFAAINTNWGGGYEFQNNAWSKGTNDFNLPDMRGVFLRGTLGGRTNFVNVGQVPDPDAASRASAIPGGNTGNKVGSVQADVVGSHQHYLPNGSGVLQPGSPYTSPYANNGFNGSFPVSPTGPGIGNESRPKNAYVNYIIKY